WLAEASQHPVEGGEAELPGGRDLDSNCLAIGVVVDQQAGRCLRHSGRALGSASREVEVRGEGAPLAERYFEVATSHDPLLLTTAHVRPHPVPRRSPMPDGGDVR